MENFESLSRGYGLVGKPYQSVHLGFAGKAIWVVWLVLVGSHSSELRIDQIFLC